MARLGCSSHRLLDPVPLPVLSQRYSTGLPSLKGYDKSYEVERVAYFRELPFPDVG